MLVFCDHNPIQSSFMNVNRFSIKATHVPLVKQELLTLLKHLCLSLCPFSFDRSIYPLIYNVRLTLWNLPSFCKSLSWFLPEHNWMRNFCKGSYKTSFDHDLNASQLAEKQEIPTLLTMQSNFHRGPHTHYLYKVKKICWSFSFCRKGLKFSISETRFTNFSATSWWEQIAFDEMSTSSRFRANQYLLLLLNVACIAKEQIQIL